MPALPPFLLAAVAGLVPLLAQSPAPLPADRQIDRLFADWDKPDSPGCVVGVFHKGEPVHLRAYGMADLERRVALAPDSVFDIASTSKQFFAFAILLLEHDGRLSLDDDVRKHLPELPAWDAPITLRHLLHHTSGIRDYLVLMALAGMPYGNDYSEARILDLIARQKALNFAPGKEHLYSNSGYFLLAEVLRRASGMTPGEFLQQRVFAPLGMTRTRLYDDKGAIVPDRAIGYVPRPAGFGTELYQFDLVGDGGVLTTARDLARWAGNFADNKLGGGAALIARMQTPGKLADGTELDYACGLRVTTWRDQRVIDHGGAWAGYRSQLVRFPDHDLTVVVLANLGTFDPDDKAMAVAAMALGDRLPPEPPAAAAPAVTEVAPVDAATLARWVGTWRGRSGRIWEIVEADGALLLRIDEQMQFPLEPVAADRCTARGAPAAIELLLAADGKALEVNVADQPARRYERIEPWVPDAAALAALVGEFRSDELDCVWRLTVQDGVLHVAIGFEEQAPLRPTVPDEFALDGAVVKAVRGEDGRVIGLRVGAGRVRDLGFVRR